MLNRKSILLLPIIFFSLTCFSAEVDTVTTYSTSMRKDIKAVVITPDSYEHNEDFPVVYLLHGYSGNYKDWIDKVPAIREYADWYGVIIVCPDGDFSSWYLDSPEKPGSKYETYIAIELVEWIDDHYKTRDEREGRAITGLSMGGHGAFFLALRHQDKFSMAGSMSRGVDLRPFPENWELPKLLGSYAENKNNWDSNSVINLTHLLTPGSLSLIFACGTDDFFYDVNVKLHEKLLLYNIPHTFISAPGGHTWDFWSEAVKYQLEFFHTEFNNFRRNDR